MCICDAISSTVLWEGKIGHWHSSGIEAFSFSPDRSRLLSAGRWGDVCIWDVSALLQDGTPSTVEDPMAQSQLDDSRAPRFLHKLRAETSRKVVAGRVEFSTNSRAVVAYGGYAPIPSPELVMCGLGLQALRPWVAGPQKPSRAGPASGLGGLEGRAFDTRSPSPALRPGLLWGSTASGTVP